MEESENAPMVYVPPLSKFCNCWEVNPGITQALELASGAIAMKVAVTELPSTEIWKGTAQPVGTFEGSWNVDLVFARIARHAPGVGDRDRTSRPRAALTFTPFVLKSYAGRSGVVTTRPADPFRFPRRSRYWPGLAGEIVVPLPVPVVKLFKSTAMSRCTFWTDGEARARAVLRDRGRISALHHRCG